MTGADVRIMLLISLLIGVIINGIQTLLFLKYGPIFTKRAILNEATEMVEVIDPKHGPIQVLRLKKEWEKILLGIVHSPTVHVTMDAFIDAASTSVYKRVTGKVGGMKKAAGEGGNLEFLQFIGEMLTKGGGEKGAIPTAPGQASSGGVPTWMK